MKQNLKDYLDRELKLQVYNTEDLYSIRYNPKLRSVLETQFIFTATQWNVLSETIDDELEFGEGGTV